MAWTKTKTAIVAGAVALAAIGLGVVAVNAINGVRRASALATMQGDWEGTLNIGPGKLRLVLKIFSTNGEYRATLDSVDQGAKDIPVPQLSAGPHSIHFAMPALGADYRGTLNSDRTEMSGTFMQLKKRFLLTLKKTTEPDTVSEMSASDYAPRAGSDVQGAWQGELKAGKTILHLNLRVADRGGGVYQGQLDSLDQGVRDMPITSMTYERPTLQFKLQEINGAFNGEVDARDDAVAGTWTQMGRKMPLTFKRAQADAGSASTEQADYGQGLSGQLQGHWKGALSVNGTQLHIVLHIGLMPDGSYTAALDSPDQGAAGIPATAVTFNYPSVRITWQTIGGVYTGRIEGKTLSGTWRQGKTSFSLQLRKDAKM